MIVVCGDFHGRFESVNKFLNSHKEITIILQCGDFGFWPRFKLSKLKNYDTKIFWCDGNHEDFEAIKKIEDVEVFPNVYYMSRGTILTLPDERKVLFMGGAYSIDKYYRTPGYDWFPEETISQKDIMDLPEENIDIVISHTCPNEFNVVDYHDKYGHDPSRDALSVVLNKYKPKLWYFGHMHLFKKGSFKDCKWTCLSGVELEGRWWIPLEEKNGIL